MRKPEVVWGNLDWESSRGNSTNESEWIVYSPMLPIPTRNDFGQHNATDNTCPLPSEALQGCDAFREASCCSADETDHVMQTMDSVESFTFPTLDSRMPAYPREETGMGECAALQTLNLWGCKRITNEAVKTVVLTGGTDTARLFKRLRPELHLLAETGGKNATVVSRFSDRDLAVNAIVQSAFGHAGQKCSATSLLILTPELADDATLVLEGPHIRIESLSLNGGLTIVNARDDATLVVRDADVANAGVAFLDIADADLPSSKPFEKIRGYKAVDEGSLRVEVPGPGHWVLTGKGDLEKVGDKAEL